MAKVKVCSFCEKETSKLYYATPKCCTNWECIRKYREQQNEKKKSNSGTGTGETKSRQIIKKTGIKTISPVSKKQAERLKEYRKVRDTYMKSKPICECCKTKPSQDLHHTRGRVGKYLTDVSNFLAVCRPCHHRIETEPNWAKENNYSRSRLHP